MNFTVFWNLMMTGFNYKVKHKDIGECLTDFSTKVGNKGALYVKMMKLMAKYDASGTLSDKQKKDILSIDLYNKDTKEMIEKEVGCEVKWDGRNYKGILNGNKVIFLVKHTKKEIQAVESLISKFETPLYSKVGSWVLNDVLRGRFESSQLSAFAESVNNKVRNCGKLSIPKGYSRYCNNTVFAVEDLGKSESNIIDGLRTYIGLVSYAILNDKQAILNLDLTDNNMVVTKDKDISFIDNSLTFMIDNKDRDNAKQLIVAFLSNNRDKMSEIIRGYFSECSDDSWNKFFKEIGDFKDANKILKACIDNNVTPDNKLLSAVYTVKQIETICKENNEEINIRHLLMEQAINSGLWTTYNKVDDILKEHVGIGVEQVLDKGIGLLNKFRSKLNK